MFTQPTVHGRGAAAAMLTFGFVVSGLNAPARAASSSAETPGAPEDGFVSVFDGKTLDGWETPDRSWWSIEDGAITGRITPEKPCTINQYLVFAGGDLADFELKLQSRLSGDGGINNGFQFRSRVLPDHDVCGYQVDNNLETPWLVRLYDEYGRHTLAWRGERARFDESGARFVEPLPEGAGEPWFSLGDWHEYHLICQGTAISLRVDGRLAASVEDRDSRRFDASGSLALQLHSGPPTVVQFKDIRIRRLSGPPPSAEGAANPGSEPDAKNPRASLIREASAWWNLDAGGHGASPPLRHFPGFEKFELNVRPSGPGRRDGSRIVTMDGAHFEAPGHLAGSGGALTVFIRARDPKGLWNAALINKGNQMRESLSFALAGRNGQDGSPVIAFSARTDGESAHAEVRLSGLPDPGAWLDLVGRYDGRTIDLFCNGRRVASAPCSGAIPAGPEPLLIAAENPGDGVTRHFRGELQTAAVWSRALTDAEVAQLSQ